MEWNGCDLLPGLPIMHDLVDVDEELHESSGRLAHSVLPKMRENQKAGNRSLGMYPSNGAR